MSKVLGGSARDLGICKCKLNQYISILILFLPKYIFYDIDKTGGTETPLFRAYTIYIIIILYCILLQRQSNLYNSCFLYSKNDSATVFAVYNNNIFQIAVYTYLIKIIRIPTFSRVTNNASNEIFEPKLP